MQTSFGVPPKTAIYYGTSTLGLDSKIYGNYFALLPMCFDAMISIVEYLLYISTYHLWFSPEDCNTLLVRGLPTRKLHIWNA